MSTTSPAPTADATRASTAWAIALLGLATLAVYANSVGVPFVFDDVPAIVDNATIRHLWPLTDVLVPRQAGGITTSGRPLVNLTLALNYALSGDRVWSYHLVNIAIHLAAGLCLFGIVRRTRVATTDGPQARLGVDVAGLVAALWLLHPLQTESVTYVVQRAESLAALCCLLTLYAFVRATESDRGRGWLAWSVGACACGMASKEAAVVAPLLVLLYDRGFVSGGWRAAWRARRGYYLALAATWLLLGALVVSTGGRGGTVGFATEISPWSYALTQTRAIVRYAALALWPEPLVFDYGLATTRRFAEVAIPALMVMGALAATVWALVRRPRLGFLAAAFFLLLAPSSSVIPVTTQTMAEHRAYLASAALVGLVAVVSFAVAGRRARPVLLTLTVALGVATSARNRDYRSEVTLWADTARKLPTNARAHNNLGQALYRAGRIDDAMAAYRRALALQPKYPETHYNLGVALAARGQTAEAVEHYETALRVQPDYPEPHNNLGNALVTLGRVDEAIRHYEAALAVKPDFAEAHNNLGNALLQARRPREAVACFRRALALKPAYPEAHYNLGNALAADGKMTDALAEFRDAIAQKPDYAEAHVNAGNALLALGRPLEAVAAYERAVTLAPGLPDAHFNLGSALLQLERWRDAVRPLETAVRLKPDFAPARRALAFALAKTGRAAEAATQYEAYLHAEPADAEARAELAQLRRGQSLP